MANNTQPELISGEILDENAEISFAQLCHSCSVQAEKIEELVEYGILDPAGTKKSHWCFRVNSIKRVQVSLRLQQDLGVNLSGIALALELLERIDELERQLHSPEQP